MQYSFSWNETTFMKKLEMRLLHIICIMLLSFCIYSNQFNFWICTFLHIPFSRWYLINVLWHGICYLKDVTSYEELVGKYNSDFKASYLKHVGKNCLMFVTFFTEPHVYYINWRYYKPHLYIFHPDLCPMPH